MVARTPFARVRSYGSARSGTREAWLMKLTSYALLPLTIFGIGLLAALAGADHATVSSTLAAPWVAVPLFLFVLANALHMRLGMDQVIEDYVHAKGPKSAAMIANVFFSYGCAAAAGYFLLMLGLGG